MYPSLCYPISSPNARKHKDGLTVYLQVYALQLKNVPRTLVAVAGVVQKMMKTLYDAHFPDAENRRPGRNPECPDSDILAIGWLLEYIGADSEHSGYQRLKVELKTVFACLPERSRFNRRRRNLSGASEVIRRLWRTSCPRRRCFSWILFRYRFATSNAPRLQV